MDPNQALTSNRLWQGLGKPGLGTATWLVLAAIAAPVLVLALIGLAVSR